MKHIRDSYWHLGILSAVLILAYTNCSSGLEGNNNSITAAGTAGAGTTSVTPQSGSNVMPVILGGYGNEPTVSVTICAHGSTTNCQTISNLLIDSGSTGLRVFSSALTASFVSGLTGTTGECYTYVDGTIDWGVVKTADVILGGETASNVPFQIISNNGAYGDGGASCYADDLAFYVSQGFLPSNSGCSVANQATQAAQDEGCPFFDSPGTGYNGLIGVNFLAQDCGTGCATVADNDLYYSCSGTTCTSSTMAVASQVSNPISYLPVDNNGITFEFPNATVGNNLTGYAILGIGTESNNMPSEATTLTADPNESDTGYTDIQAQWQAQTIYAFLDTGSNTYNFPYSNTTSTVVANYPIMPTDPNTDAFTPSATETFTVTNIGFNGAQLGTGLSIENVEANFNTYNVVNYIGIVDQNGPIDGQFDWGFPFFLGRTVYVGLEGKTSSLGSGLYWAY
jgi:Protein of unknown function (DUF3443)